MGHERRRPSSDSHRWLIFAFVSLIYFLSLFNRVSTSVIAQDLMAAFQSDATALGLMSSMYFWFYAVEQPLVGHWTDRLGPRRVIGIWALLAASGCVLFGMAPSIEWAMAGRALIGLGAGGIYVPALKAFAQWFRKQEFAMVNGFMLASGNMGAIAATTPLVWLVGLWGWRTSFLMIGVISLTLALGVFAFMRDAGTDDGPGREMETTRPPVGETLASLRFWFPVTIFLFVFGSFVTFQGLWASPFLMSVFSLSRLQASQLNMLIPIGFIVGAPLSGWLVGRITAGKVPVMIGLLAVETACWLGMTICPTTLGKEGLAALFLVMGAGCGGLANILWSWVRDTTPASVMGFTTGLINPSTFLGVAVLQVVTGAVLDHVGRVGGVYPPAAYRDAFAICLLLTAACLALTICLRAKLAR